MRVSRPGVIEMSVIESASDIAKIDPKELFERQQRGEVIEVIDVRTPAEFRSVHASIATLAPLDELDPKRFMEGRPRNETPLYFICRSGTRSDKACEKFLKAGYRRVFSVAGGTVAWEKAGLPVVRGRWMLPLDRQVQITAGTMALAGFVLGEARDPNWFYLSGFVGCGLLFAGLTGFCPLGWVIAGMPWNQAGRDSSCCVDR